MTTEAEQSTNEDKSTEKPAITGWLAHERRAKEGLCIPFLRPFPLFFPIPGHPLLKPTEFRFLSKVEPQSLLCTEDV